MSRGKYSLPLALPTLLALTACEPETAVQYWTTTDSAGVRIVVNEPTAEARPATWSLSSPAEVLIEQDETHSNQTWTYLRSAFWLADSRIGVGVSDPPFVRIYNPDGTLSSTLAPQGQGPGELRAAVWAGAWGDSLLVRGPAGLAVFDASGVFSSTIRFPGGESAEILTSTPEGWVVQVEKPYDDMHGTAPPQVTRSFSVLRVDIGGEIRDTMLTFETPYLSRLTYTAWGGVHPATSDGERVLLLDSDAYEIHEFMSGRLTSIARAPVPTLQEYSQAHFAEMEEIWGPVASMMIEQDQDAGRMSVPPAVSLKLDESTGDVWVRRTDDGSEDFVTWDIFDTGVWVATVDVPREFTIQQIRDGRVLGSWTDEFDVTGVRVYSVVESQ